MCGITGYIGKKNNAIEVVMNGLYKSFIPLSTTKQFDHAKITCTGRSNEDTNNLVRLNAKSPNDMRACPHAHKIPATIETWSTNSIQDYSVLNYHSDTPYGDFRFFYENKQSSMYSSVNVCLDCGYYEKR